MSHFYDVGVKAAAEAVVPFVVVAVPDFGNEFLLVLLFGVAGQHYVAAGVRQHHYGRIVIVVAVRIRQRRVKVESIFKRFAVHGRRTCYIVYFVVCGVEHINVVADRIHGSERVGISFRILTRIISVQSFAAVGLGCRIVVTLMCSFLIWAKRCFNRKF